MITIIGIVGSVRIASLNGALLRAAAQFMPPGSQLKIATIKDIPLYDGDLEAAEGIPPSVAALKDQIVRADGLLLGTPEYNNSIPGVFKNAIDWLSRPPSRYPTSLPSSPRCSHWRFSWWIWHYSGSECLAAACPTYARVPALVWRTVIGIARQLGIRCNGRTYG